MNIPSSFVEPVAECLAIVGVGLIGGSLAAAVRQRGLARQIIGVGRDPERLEPARARGLIDACTADLTAAAREADLIVFCTPPDRIAAGVRAAAGACRRGTLITDAGSTKQLICAAAATGLPAGVDFVGSHPLAGSEKQGFDHADANLFEGRLCVVTPVETTPRPALDRTIAFWQRVGMRVIEMSPGDHDAAVAETSHLPHLVASALAATLSESRRDLAASGFRDTTRIAAGDPQLWTTILLQNAEAVLQSLERFSTGVANFREALQARDVDALHRLLEAGKQQRDRL
ncbi:MAG TPA: prephenate dehydrogenase [Planctomycetaceae bacterium]|nr:prephenate dehydrogenase [Planctomycetaceae bacterium]